MEIWKKMWVCGFFSEHSVVMFSFVSMSQVIGREGECFVPL